MMLKRKIDLYTSNKNVYGAKDIIKYYLSKIYYLRGPELAILDKFRPALKYMKMLDIGVGTGRTTHYFAGLVKEYIGIDYSEGMINACKQKFTNIIDNVSFKVSDVKALIDFPDNYFDFILFSCNGIDYMGHEDRLKALQEIHRVGKNGCFFFFSTHNLECIDYLFKINLSFHPIRLIRELKRALLIYTLNKNPRKFKDMKYAIINDGALNFRLRTYYIKPTEQIKQLEDSGFTNIVIYSPSDGKEIIDRSKFYTSLDSRLDFLTNIYKYHT